MSGILDRLKEWGCEESGNTGTPARRALCLWLSRDLASAAAEDADIQIRRAALASVDELIAQAKVLRKRIERPSGTEATGSESRGRIEILNWRRHGDDESYCRVEVFGSGDATVTEILVENEYGVSSEAENRGDYAAAYYVNDDITIEDGEIRTSHDGQRFRVSVVAAD